MFECLSVREGFEVGEEELDGGEEASRLFFGPGSGSDGGGVVVSDVESAVVGGDNTFRLVEELKDKDGVLKDSDIFEIADVRVLHQELSVDPIGGMVEGVLSAEPTAHQAVGRLHGAEVEEVDGAVQLL